MSDGRLGIWLIGAWGRVGTAVAVVLAALQSHLISKNGLVTEQPEFARLDLADWSCFVVGGHEIRKARNLFAGSQFVTSELLSQVAPAMTTWDRNVRTGTLLNSGSEIESRANTATLKTRGERPNVALRRISADVEDFRRSGALEHMIVLNLASIELPPAPACRGLSCAELLQILESADRSPVPTSTLYAAAAMQSDCSYLNFTQSLGSDLPPLHELARQTGSLHMGREGRLDLALIGLLHTQSAGEDGAGGDSLRAAQALLDVTRLCEREHGRGQSGVLTQLGCFFESPMSDGPSDLPSQLKLLSDWADQVSCQSP
jgi:myo-inositol-1-phosphate synthase